MASGHGWVLTTRLHFVRYGRKAAEGVWSRNRPIPAEHRGTDAARIVSFGSSTGRSGSGVARHAILATNAPNVRFLPIPSALPSGADAPSAIVDSRF